ncbi:MAG: GNAT family N-acetyltransferase [Eubacteriales bacterium]|nr:GNAT family N-acetyltransferase [Eubacteriales bacterium]
MNIRAYNQNDFERIAEIHDVARKVELASANLSDAFLTLEQTYVNEGLFDNTLLVAEIEGKVVGFVAYSNDEITWLYVDQSYQRQKIGETLLRSAIYECGNTVRLEVLVGNDRALNLYQKVGFRIAETKSGKLVGFETFPATGHIMELQKSEQSVDAPSMA